MCWTRHQRRMPGMCARRKHRSQRRGRWVSTRVITMAPPPLVTDSGPSSAPDIHVGNSSCDETDRSAVGQFGSASFAAGPNRTCAGDSPLSVLELEAADADGRVVKEFGQFWNPRGSCGFGSE